MKNAISQLTAIMEQKTVHATKDILESMRALCAMPHLFTSSAAQQAFGQVCRNFEIACETEERTSWGRKQFSIWWNVQCSPNPGEFRQEYVGVPHPIEPPKPSYQWGVLPQVPGAPKVQTRDEEGNFYDLEAANTYIRAVEFEYQILREKLKLLSNIATEALKL